MITERWDAIVTQLKALSEELHSLPIMDMGRRPLYADEFDELATRFVAEVERLGL